MNSKVGHLDTPSSVSKEAEITEAVTFREQ